MSARHEIIFSSILTPETPIGDVARIARVGHRYNKDHDITGLLLFDGERFCEYLEGERGNVERLLDKIRGDPRHEFMTVHYQGDHPGPRLYRHWSMGYVLMQQGRRLDRFEGVAGFAAVELLLELQEVWEITWFEMW
jgi:hypothetical protein